MALERNWAHTEKEKKSLTWVGIELITPERIWINQNISWVEVEGLVDGLNSSSKLFSLNIQSYILQCLETILNVELRCSKLQYFETIRNSKKHTKNLAIHRQYLTIKKKHSVSVYT